MQGNDVVRVVIEDRGHVRLVGLNRPEKHNAFDCAMLAQLARAYTEADDDDQVRCLVVHGLGKSFTAGLDLAEVGPAVRRGETLFPRDGVDPLGLGTQGRRRRTPVVMVAQGWCLTIGIELLLSADIRVAADDTRFGQIEINRGIFPFGGATVRLPQVAGWGNAMRWLLTGDQFDAAEALRIGLVQEVVPAGQQLERAVELAQTVAKRAPLGVAATLQSSWKMLEEGPKAAAEALADEARRLMDTEDAMEGMRSFVERREGRFQGR